MSEKRLIDADALETRMGNLCDEFGTDHLFIDAIIYEIENAPTIDAVEVIRCESCKWYEPECENCDFWGGYRNPDHYCGEGERKNEAG